MDILYKDLFDISDADEENVRKIKNYLNCGFFAACYTYSIEKRLKYAEKFIEYHKEGIINYKDMHGLHVFEDKYIGGCKLCDQRKMIKAIAKLQGKKPEEIFNDSNEVAKIIRSL